MHWVVDVWPGSATVTEWHKGTRQSVTIHMMPWKKTVDIWKEVAAMVGVKGIAWVESWDGRSTTAVILEE